MPTKPMACTWSRTIHERTLMNVSARWLALLMAPLLLAAACGEATDPTPGIDGEETAMGHIHGIGIDPADGTLYAATHFGLFRVDDQTVVRVADRWQDTMAFTVGATTTSWAAATPICVRTCPHTLASSNPAMPVKRGGRSPCRARRTSTPSKPPRTSSMRTTRSPRR